MAEEKYILLTQALDVLDRQACWWAHDSMESIPAADVAPIVRCKDCFFWCKEMSDDGKTEFVSYSYCQRGIRGDGRDFYCALGKRRSHDISG